LFCPRGALNSVDVVVVIVVAALLGCSSLLLIQQQRRLKCALGRKTSRSTAARHRNGDHTALCYAFRLTGEASTIP
jgi:hypothetical protein